MRPLALAAAALLGAACSTPLAQLKRELGPRSARELACPEGKLSYEELEKVISTTRVQVKGCGKDVTWQLVESRWTRVRPVAAPQP